MKKLILALCLLLMVSVGAAGEEMQTETAPTVAEIALTMRPESEEPTHLTVGNSTKVSGSFFTTQFGNNTSDIDVRYMLHGYNPIVWMNQLEFTTDPMVVDSLESADTRAGRTYTIRIVDGLTYNDGVTPVTAEDYVFSYLLLTSPQFAALGANTGAYAHVVGYEAFSAGETDVFSGVRLIDERTFSVTVKAQYEPYFYELSYLSVYPYPIGVIAPGCEVRDDGEGAYIANIDETAVEPVFTAELLQSTVLDAENGYLSHPYLTCGPYKLVSYDRESGTVEFAINEFYVGNYEGVRPVIDTVTLVPVLPQDMKEKLESGEIDLLNKVVDGDVVNSMRSMLSEGYSLLNYARLGYGFCAFACEQGPQQFKAVRQAIDYCFDADSFVRDALKGYGVTVNGYYGLGQWMTLAAMGTIRPEGITPKEEEVWDALNLDELNPYTLDLGKAKALLEEDGWTLNENGEPFDETRDAVRCKDVDGELMRLSLDFAQVKDNDFAQLVVDQFSETLPQVGIELVVHEVSFNEMLSDYYREDGERLYDMNFMATNFVSTFDPFMTFTDDPDFVGAMNTSGMTDEQLIDMTWDMHKTEPYDVLTYEQKWIEFQKYYNELLPTMPIYSNVYFDFHTNWLQNYYAGSEINWPEAVLYAYIAEPVETAPDEVQSGLDLDDDMKIDGGNDFGDDDFEIIE